MWEEATRAPLFWIVPGQTKPNGVCERPVDFMSIYPTLVDLCGIPKPAHVEGENIRKLLADPQADWDKAAITTHGFKNNAVRTEGWRYIRYSQGGEELYDEKADPYEWKNLAAEASHNARKSELAKFIPTKDAPDITGVDGARSAKKGKNKGGKKAKAKMN